MSGRFAGVLAVVGWLTTLVLAVGLVLVSLNRPPVIVTAVVNIPTSQPQDTSTPLAVVQATLVPESTSTLPPTLSPTLPPKLPAARPPAPPAFVGTVSDSDAFIGISRNGNELLVYVCDGKQGKRTISEWFRGRIPEGGGSVTLTSEGGAQLAFELGANGATGNLILKDGKERSFTADQVTGDGGLARVEDQKDGKPRVRGWIFMPDGRFRGDGFPTDCACDDDTGNVYCPIALADQPVSYFTWCTDCCP